MPMNLVSLRPWLPDNFGNPYRHEAGLTSRLDEAIFPELQRRMDYIRTMLPALQAKKKVDKDLLILYPEPGSCAEIVEGFLPDRCALAKQTYERQRTSCAGEIKPSYKIQSKWGPPSGAFGWALDDVNPTAIQFKTVLAQVKFYMRVSGEHSDGTTLQYGYIITDHEVMLVKRDPNVLYSIYVSVGFPLYPDFPGQEDWDADQAIQSGMTALVLIHLLAGAPDCRVAANN